MQKDYIVNHYNIGLFIHEMMSRSSIISLELDIYQEKILLYPRFADSNGSVEWFENKSRFVNLVQLSQHIFIQEKISFDDFLELFHQAVPLGRNKDFSDYLKSFMDKRLQSDFSFYFEKYTLGEDINRFWGNHIKSYFLQEKLQLDLPSTPYIKAGKI